VKASNPLVGGAASTSLQLTREKRGGVCQQDEKLAEKGQAASAHKGQNGSVDQSEVDATATALKRLAGWL
jgi:hypothetical protein